MTYSEYYWEKPETCMHPYIFPALIKTINELNVSPDALILDAGCGGGNILHKLYKRGFKKIYGFDASESGIKIAKRNFLEIEDRFVIHNAYEKKLPDTIPEGNYDLILSVEVIEHLYSPHVYLQNIHQWLKKGGYLILTTPYHGYLKNIAISLFNKFDKHFNPLWEGGHIKFFTKKTLYALLRNSGFIPEKFIGIGRVSFLWKCMMILAKKI